MTPPVVAGRKEGLRQLRPGNGSHVNLDLQLRNKIPRTQNPAPAGAPPAECRAVAATLLRTWLKLPVPAPADEGAWCLSASGLWFSCGHRCLWLRTEQGRRAQCRPRGHRWDQHGLCTSTARAAGVGAVSGQATLSLLFSRKTLSGQKQAEA